MSRLQVITGGGGNTLDIIIPDKLNKYKENTKGLWLLHDKFGTSVDWPGFSQIEFFAEDHNFIIVCLSCGDASYTDWKDGFEWETYLTEEIWKYVHGLIPMLSERPEDNYLCGCARGGFGAIKFALAHWDKFGFAAAFSPDNSTIKRYLKGEEVQFGDRMYGSIDQAVKSNDNLEYAAECLAKSNEKLPEIYIACGFNNSAYECSVEMREMLFCKNYAVIWKESDSDGGWIFYNEQIKKLLDYIEGCD